MNNSECKVAGPKNKPKSQENYMRKYVVVQCHFALTENKNEHKQEFW